MQIYGVKIPNNENKIPDVLNLLSDKRRIRIAELRHFPDRIRSVLAETLLRILIIRTLEVENKVINFGFNNFGKPYLLGYPNFHFNISHSGEYVICAIDHNPVGIDIEEKRNIDLKIAYHFFTNNEIRYIDELSIKRLERFYSIWTAKESYLKFIGKGLSVPLNSFTIDICENTIKLSEISGKKITDPVCFFKSYDISNNYKITLCSKNGVNYPITIKELKYGDLFAEFIEYSNTSTSIKVTNSLTGRKGVSF